jgi:hypothetical protein
MTNIALPAPEGDDAQVVAIGQNKFGVLWRGELRREQYPTQRLAVLALARLAAGEHARPAAKGGIASRLCANVRRRHQRGLKFVQGARAWAGLTEN